MLAFDIIISSCFCFDDSFLKVFLARFLFILGTFLHHANYRWLSSFLRIYILFLLCSFFTVIAYIHFPKFSHIDTLCVEWALANACASAASIYLFHSAYISFFIAIVPFFILPFYHFTLSPLYLLVIVFISWVKGAVKRRLYHSVIIFHYYNTHISFRYIAHLYNIFIKPLIYLPCVHLHNFLTSLTCRYKYHM